MRRPFIAGNWKMYKTIPETEEYLAEFISLTKGVEGRDIVFGVPAPSLQPAVKAVKGATIGIAAENCHWEAEGAYTGEISIRMIEATGAGYVIIGHSERRQYFGETDETVNKKVGAALAGSLTAIVCIGETLEEREGEKTFDVIERQLKNGLAGTPSDKMERVVVAYEPVWAIGTGLTATPDQAQEVHRFIREKIENLFDENIANKTKILYGGSVKPGNIGELMAKPDIDGVLVGGASLTPKDFAAITKF